MTVNPMEETTPSPFSPTGRVPFLCDVQRVNASAVVFVHGDLDLATAPQLLDEMDAACDAGVSHLSLVMSYVTFMDSSGLSSLVQARERAARRGVAFALVSASRPVRKILELTGTAEVLGIPSPDRE